MASEIQTALSAGDASVVEFIRAMTEHPITTVFFVSLFACIAFIFYTLIKPQQALEGIKALFSLKRFRRRKFIGKELGKEDLIKHQIFKDIQFFLEYRLDQIYSSETFTRFDKAKLAIGHDLLAIKLQNALLWIKEFVTNTNFDDPYLNVRALLKHKLEKHRAFVWGECKKIGVPQDFLEKFMEVCKIHTNYLALSLEDLLSDKIPLSIYERVYLVLGCLTQYYTTIVVDMKDVIQSINGDLKGQVYKDMIIGGNDYRCYPVPNREYIPLVEKKLQELCLATQASRSSIYVIHDFVGDDYLQGYFSKIYEYDSSGFSPLMMKFQYKSATCLVDFISVFKQHGGLCIKTNRLNEVLSNMLSGEGVCAVGVYPIFSRGMLRGFIGVEYSTLEVFEKLNTEEIIELLKKYSSILNYYTDYTKTGFTYEGNSVKGS